MRIVHYCQHVLGVGHFFRSLEIARALAPHQVDLVTGGEHVPAPVPDHIRHVPLPPLSMDGDFQLLKTRRSAQDEEDPGAVAAVMEQRRARLLEHMHAARPDVFLVELFPFGRKRFGFELLPVLEAVRQGALGACKAVCSVRDILVEKSDQAKFERRVLEQLNALFDLVLVHADPDLVRLEETFSRVDEIVPELRYTGYVAPSVDLALGPSLREELGLGRADTMIVASAGGGAVGGELLDVVLDASGLLRSGREHVLCMFTGPFMADDQYRALEERADRLEHVRLRRFTDRFGAWLAAADLSVSMGGYNTTMNLLATGTFGLVLPFAQNREQAMRARRLEQRGLLSVLGTNDLRPHIMCAKMNAALTDPRCAPIFDEQSTMSRTMSGIDLNGAAATARIIAGLSGKSGKEHG